MLTHLGRVTETLKNLLDAEIRVNGGQDFVMSAAPPDGNQTAGERVVSVYLFHVLESADLRNLPPRGGSSPVPVRQQPMGLILQYLVTVVAPDEAEPTDTETITQQQLIGYAARAIHDYPIVSDKTQILVPDETEARIILHSELRGIGTVLRFNLRPASMEETITFWTAQDKNVPRLSLFVEARVVLLESKPAEVAPGIVLSVGQFIYASAEPQLIASHASTFFVPPGNTAARSVESNPARVALFDALNSTSYNALQTRNAALIQNNQLALEASGLAPGKRVLVLRNPRETIRIPLDQAPGTVPLLNQQWVLTPTNNGVTLRVFQQVVDVDGVTRTITAGIYGARVIVYDDRLPPEPRPRSSNEVPLTITPQVLSVVPATTPFTGTAVYTLTLVSASIGFRSEIGISIGGRALRPSPPAPPLLPPPSLPALEAGEYRVLYGAPPAPGEDPTPSAQIVFRVPFVDPAAASPVPIVPSDENPLAVRLVVDGATATPDWLTVAAP